MTGLRSAGYVFLGLLVGLSFVAEHVSAASFQSLGTLGGASKAKAVSADGSVVVGESYGPSGNEAFVWTPDTGMMGLGDLLEEGISHARGVSADGSVVAGTTVPESRIEAFLWTGTGIEGLGALPGGVFYSTANGVSADGSVVVGQSDSALGHQAFLWRSGTGMVGLGNPPGGNYGSEAHGASADGSVVVGESFSASGDQEAFLWDSTNGMRNLEDALTDDYGLNLTGWTLSHAWDVSDDGLTIVGWGLDPSGYPVAWRANTAVPIPAGVWLLGSGLIGLVGIRKRLHK